jgi:hypothetical protein
VPGLRLCNSPWIDNEGTDRRRKIRRKDDRDRIVKKILDDTLFTEG